MIPANLYKKIVELVPILCVDVVLVHEGQYVLLRRKNDPLKGMWWVPGGRALKGEPTLKAAKRKVHEETGLKAHNFRIRGIYEDSYKRSAWGTPTSSVSIVYQAEVAEFSPKIDKTSSNIKLSDFLPKRFAQKTKFI